jgi:hypothetical protein
MCSDPFVMEHAKLEITSEQAKLLMSIGARAIGALGGAKGGAAKSMKKARSSRKNGKLGGRPRKHAIPAAHKVA